MYGVILRHWARSLNIIGTTNSATVRMRRPVTVWLGVIGLHFLWSEEEVKKTTRKGKNGKAFNSQLWCTEDTHT